MAQKSGCYASADVLGAETAICMSPAGAAEPQQTTGRAGVARVASALGQTAASRTSFVRSVRCKPLLFNANTQTKAFVAPGRDLITFLLVRGDATDIRHEHTGFPRDIGADVP